jgi:hypothetical protein
VVGWYAGEREDDGSMAQQKLEDCVVPDGGVMPVQPDEVVGQGKAVPVDEMAGQLCLPIVTAEHRSRVPERSGAGRAVRPKTIVNVKSWAPVTMEEVAYRLADALVKVVQNKGAPGPDGQTVEELRERWPTAGRKLDGDLLAGSYRPGVTRRAMIPKAGDLQAVRLMRGFLDAPDRYLRQIMTDSRDHDG